MVTEKACIKCGETKPLAEFHAHPKMRDGHLNKCKACACADSRAHRVKNSEHYSSYERDRKSRPERKAQQSARVRRMRENRPERERARYLTSNAIRDGRLVRQPCEVCGATEVEAHHDDYSKPLDVRWLCFTCHRAHHGRERQAS